MLQCRACLRYHLTDPTDELAGMVCLHRQYFMFQNAFNCFLDGVMTSYCKNKEECQRQMLLKEFDGCVNFIADCSCCDICEVKCTCMKCSSTMHYKQSRLSQSY